MTESFTANVRLDAEWEQAQGTAYASVLLQARHRTACPVRNQAVRIPWEFELEGAEALVRWEGDRLVIEPVRKSRLLDLLARLQPLPEEFPDVDDTLVSLDDVEI